MADYVTQAILTANIANFMQGMKTADEKYSEFIEKASRGPDGVVNSWSKFGAKMQAIGSTATQQLTTPLVAFGVKAVSAAADAQAMEAQFEQTFGDMAGSAQDSLDAIANETGMLPNRIKPSFSLLTGFAKTAGMDTKDALGLAERATRAAADSAAYYDRSVEAATESLMSFLKGNYANDAALGISVTETTRNAKANELYGQSFKDLSEAQKQLTLLAMVEDGNKLSGALGQAARESDGLTNQLGNAKQAFKDASADLGQVLLPTVVDVLKNITNLAKGFADLPDGVQKGIMYFGLFTAAAGPVLSVSGKIVSGIGNTVDAFSRLSNGATDAVGALGKTSSLGLWAAALGVAAAIGVAFYASLTKVNPKVKEFRDAVQKSKESLRENLDAASENAVVASTLKDEIFSLAGVENKSAAQKEHLVSLIGQLNNIVPDLNLAYDAETDSLNLGNDAISQRIDLMQQEAEEAAKVQAYKEQLDARAKLLVERKKLLKALEDSGYSSQAVLDSASSFGGPNAQMESWGYLLNQLQDINTELETSEKNLQFYKEMASEAFTEAGNAAGRISENAAEASREEQKLQAALANTSGTASASKTQYTEYQQSVIDVYRSLGGEYAKMTEEQIFADQKRIQSANDAYGNLTEKEKLTVNAYKATNDVAITMTNERILMIAELEEKAQERREESYKSHLDRLRGSAIEQQQVDLETFTQQMEENAATYEAYYANRAEIQKRMQTEEYDGLREWLLSLGVENTNALDEIVRMTDEQLQEYAKTFQRTGNDAKTYSNEALTAMIANMASKLEEGGVTLGEDATQLNLAIVRAFNDLGPELETKTSEGIAALAQAIADNSGLPEEQAHALKDSIIEILSESSEKVNEGGKNDVDGYTSGLKEKAPEAKEEARKARAEAQGKFTDAGTGNPQEGGRRDVGEYEKGTLEKKPDAVRSAKSVKDDSVAALEGKSEANKKGLDLSSGFTDAVKGGEVTAKVVGAALSTTLLYAIQTGLQGGNTTKTPEQMGADTAQGIVNGVNSMLGSIQAAGVAAGAAFTAGYQSQQQQHSPSRLMREKGRFSGQGIVLGAEDEMANVEAAGFALGEAFTKGFNPDAFMMPDLAYGLSRDLQRTDNYSRSLAADEDRPSRVGAPIVLQLGKREYAAFVEDLFGENDQKVRLEDAYAL